RVCAGNELGIIRHTVRVTIRLPRPIWRDSAEECLLPKIRHTVLVRVGESVVALKNDCAARSQDVGLRWRRNVIGYISKLEDVPTWWCVGDQSGNAFAFSVQRSTQN